MQIAVIILSLCILGIAAVNVPREILEAPMSQLVAQDQGYVTFNCRVKGEEIEWIINSELSTTHRNLRLIGQGVMFTKTPRSSGAEINATLTFPSTLRFNTTRVKCVSLNATGTLTSGEAVMIIAGAPLPPVPQVQALDERDSTILVYWDEPFTWTQFPIISYNLTVFYEDGFVIVHLLDSIERSQVLDISAQCSEIKLQVMARNREGESAPGETFYEGDSHAKFSRKPAIRFIKEFISFNATQLEREILICVEIPVICAVENLTYSIVFIHQSAPALALSRSISYYNSSASGECTTNIIGHKELIVGTEYTIQLIVNRDYESISSSFITFMPELNLPEICQHDNATAQEKATCNNCTMDIYDQASISNAQWGLIIAGAFIIGLLIGYVTGIISTVITICCKRDKKSSSAALLYTSTKDSGITTESNLYHLKSQTKE